MEKVYELYNKMLPIKQEIKERSLSYIKERLENSKGNHIDFCDEDGEPLGGTTVYVTYDGGNHPEYYADPYSVVHSIYMKNNKIYIDCDGDSQYELENVEWGDIFDIADFLYKIVK